MQIQQVSARRTTIILWMKSNQFKIPSSDSLDPAASSGDHSLDSEESGESLVIEEQPPAITSPLPQTLYLTTGLTFQHLNKF